MPQTTIDPNRTVTAACANNRLGLSVIYCFLKIACTLLISSGILKMPIDLNIQVFATSHSWDAVEAFQKAAAEVPDEGLLIRLSRKDNAIIPTLFREEELAVATREKIEVR